MKAPDVATEEPGLGFIVILVASTFLMGSSFVAGKVLLSAGFPAMFLVGSRFLVAALATLPLVWVERRNGSCPMARSDTPLRDNAVVAAIGLLQTGAVMGLLFLAMRSISASTAAILLFTNPIWVAVLGYLFLGESLNRARVSGLLLGTVGVCLAIGLKAGVSLTPAELVSNLIGLASALCWAAATIINKRAALAIGTWSLSFWQMLIGSAALLATSYATGEAWPSVVTAEQWGWFVWLAIPASTGSFGLWFAALKKGGATRTSAYLFLAPLFTVVLSFPILGTSLTTVQILGGVLIGIALWLVNREVQPRPAARG